MSNILLQALEWTPAESWNGTSFSLTTAGPPLTYAGTVAAGDVVAFGITVVSAPDGDPDIVIEVNGEVFATIDGAAGLPATYESAAIAGGATVTIAAQASGVVPEEATFVAMLTNQYIDVPGRPDTEYLTVFRNGEVFPLELAPNQNGDGVAWSPGAIPHLAFAGGDGIYVYRIGDTEMEFVPVNEQIPFVCRSCAYSPDGAHLAVGATDGRCYIYAVGATEYTLLQTLTGLGVDPFADTTCLAYAPDSQTLLTGANKVRVLDRSGDTYTENAAGTTALAGASGSIPLTVAMEFSPSGDRVAITNREAVKVYNAPAWTEVSTGIAGFDAAAVRWSPDETLLAVVLYSNSVRVYNAATYALAQTLTFSTARPGGMSFSAEGDVLFVAVDKADETFPTGLASVTTADWSITYEDTNPLGYSYPNSVDACLVGGAQPAELLLTPLAIEVPVPCEEIGPVSKADVSAFNRTRLHSVRVLPGEKRCLVANFNGAVPPARTIATAEWRMESNVVASMANGQLLSPYRETEVTVTAHLPGVAPLECRATFDNGEVYVQRFMVEVMNGWLLDTPAPSGQLTITLSAP